MGEIIVSGSCGHKFTFVLVKAATVLPLGQGQPQVYVMEGEIMVLVSKEVGSGRVMTLP